MSGSSSLSLFVYGSLQIPEVMETVCGRRFTGEPAVLEGFARRRLEARTYPGLVPAAERTDGVVYTGLSEHDMEILDLFEGDSYERVAVDIRAAGGRAVHGYVYVIVEGCRGLLTNDPWDLDAFRAADLEAFLESCRAFRREVLRGPDAGR